jgi:hypothetical protein
MSSNQAQTALARPVPAAIEPWRTGDWQRVWLSLQAKPWTALAIVPASMGAPPEFSMRIGITLARTGMVHLASPIHVADGTDVQLSTVISFQEEIEHCRRAGGRILIALSPISQNPVSETLAQSADFSLLCLLFENMESAEASKTVKRIGRDRFIGSAIFRADVPSL